jgi:hypothetical protein
VEEEVAAFLLLGFLFFSVVLGFELRAYTLSHSTSPDRVSQTICPGLASNHNPPDLCFLSSQDSRREPPAPGSCYQFCFTLTNLELKKKSS